MMDYFGLPLIAHEDLPANTLYIIGLDENGNTVITAFTNLAPIADDEDPDLAS